jgi:membrane-anchored protein YejM (alkaline phosphatase superfamily)
MFMLGFPLLLIPFAIYNIIAFLMPGVAWGSVVSTVHMMSGVDWTMTTGDVLVALSILLLCGEVMKSSRISRRTIIDHALSLILFLGMLIEFILVKQAATATFFLLLVVGFIDVLGGFAFTLRSAQRDLTVEGVERVSP